MKSTLLNKVKVVFKILYSSLESIYRPTNYSSRRSKCGDRNILRLNKLVKRFYKRPELQLLDFDKASTFDFEATDGLKIKGIIYKPNPESKKYVIATHWFAGHKYWSLFHARVFAEMGYNIISFDFRGHGESQDDTTTMGAKEVRDLMGAIKWTKENIDYDHLALMGTSMGAFVINYAGLKFSDELEKAKVKFSVTDAPYGSIESLILHTRDMHLKILPKKRTKKTVQKMIQKHNDFEAKNNVNLLESDVFIELEKGSIPKIPNLFIHSKDDKVTSPFDTYRFLLERKNLIKGDRLLMFNYSTHTQSIRIHFKEYQRAVAQYIADMDNDQESYNKLEKKWHLDIVEKKDMKSERLK